MNIRYFVSPIRRARGLWSYVRIFGFRGPLYALYSLISRSKLVVRVARNWSHHPIYLRLNSSDILVFKQVFMEAEYGVVSKLPDAPDAIIDAGANIGLTSIYLANLYPKARILAIEPDAANLRIMRLNTSGYDLIQCVDGALWKRDEALNIVSPNSNDWAFRVTNEGLTDERSVRGYRLDSLQREYGMEHVSLLKMDIEGSEYEVMYDSESWIDNVDNIILELHESIRPGCTDLFFQRTRDFTLIAKTRELTPVSRKAGSTQGSA